MVPMLLNDKKGLIVGIANEHSIAAGCAKAFHEAGANLAVTYLSEKAKPFVEPIAKDIEADLFLPEHPVESEKASRLFGDGEMVFQAFLIRNVAGHDQKPADTWIIQQVFDISFDPTPCAVGMHHPEGFGNHFVGTGKALLDLRLYTGFVVWMNHAER